MSKPLEPLLYPLFNYLRRHKVPLGVSEYQVAVETLRAGVALESRAQLKQFCALLWVKSSAERELFETGFTTLVEPYLALSFTQIEPTETTPASSTVSPARTPETSDPERSSQPNVSRPDTPPRDKPEPTPTPQPTPTLRSLDRPHRFRPTSTLPEDLRYAFLQTPRLPLTVRDVANIWRNLRQIERIGPRTELDVEATINHICKTGFLSQPQFRPRPHNQLRLLILLDRRGSMTPYQPLINTILQGINQSGLVGRVQTFYFHDCPEAYLYQQPTLLGATPINTVLSHHASHQPVLIISDAGAARRDYDTHRIEQTRSFLRQLRQQTYLYCWLNPVPSARWRGTTAHTIAQLAPMAPATITGLHDAVSWLRGHPFPPEVSLDA